MELRRPSWWRARSAAQDVADRNMRTAARHQEEDEGTTVRRIVPITAAVPRRADPGDTFAPKPVPRTDRGVMPIRAGQGTITIPAGVVAEARFQLANGDWTPWRDAPAGVVTNPVAAIAGQWRVKGNTQD